MGKAILHARSLVPTTGRWSSLRRPRAGWPQRLDAAGSCGGFPYGSAVEDLAHVDLQPGLRRDEDAIQIEGTTRSPGHRPPGVTMPGVERIGSG
ncbi:MAG: hypothetical protein ACREYE_21965 [Gammaproteobacteria bacterium]